MAVVYGNDNQPDIHDHEVGVLHDNHEVEADCGDNHEEVGCDDDRNRDEVLSGDDPGHHDLVHDRRGEVMSDARDRCDVNFRRGGHWNDYL